MRGGRGGGGTAPPTLSRVQGELGTLLANLQARDATPTSQTTAAVVKARKSLASLQKRWGQIKDKEVPAMNEKLRQAKLPELSVEGVSAKQPGG